MLGLARYAAIAGGFSPAGLFSAGEQGVFYDPTDVNINWRRNLLTYTEQFDVTTGGWTKNAVTATNTTATNDPLGGATADIITETATTSYHSTYQSALITAGTTVAFSCFLKKGTWQYAQINAQSGSISTRWFQCVIDLDTGTITQQSAGAAGTLVSATRADAGNGWWRVVLIGSIPTDTTIFAMVGTVSGATPTLGNYGMESRLGSTANTIYAWGAQLEQSSTATAYQQIITPEITYLQTIQPQPVLFQDAAGTKPVIGVEGNGYVGLMLDKSKGLVLGNELSNAATQTLATATGTQSGAGWNVTATGAFAILSQPTVLTSARWYKIRFKWSGNTNARTIRFYVGGSGGTNSIYTAGTATSGDVTFYASTGTQNTNAYFQINDSVNGDTFYLEITSVRELPGNHAFQTSDPKRPQLRARYNLLTYTEEFDNAAWGKGGIDAFGSGSVINATTAPDGTNTADLIKENTVNTSHWVRIEAQLAAASTQYVFSVYAKNIDRDYITVAFRGASSNYASATFNLTGSGAVSSSAALGAGYAVNSATISRVGNGWFRCVLTFTAGTNVSSQSSFLALSNNGALNTDGIPSYTGTGLTLYQWGADLRPADQATGAIGPTYQRVAAANVYDTAGFLPYLEFDGNSWSMQTNNIDFSAVPTDKMTVWAGVRKLSDAAPGVLAETSASFSSNNGSFLLQAPDNATSGRYWAGLRGDSGNATSISTTYLAPITNVLSFAMDIGAASPNEIIPRINSATPTVSASGDAGTGNFGNYPLYIGQRGGSTLPFNGWLTSLIIRGAQTSDSQISATENWVNRRTGAY